MEKISMSYSAFKQLVFIDCAGMRYKSIIENDSPKTYRIMARDGDGILYDVAINETDNAADVTDYEENYLDHAQKNMVPIDTNTGTVKTFVREVEGTLSRVHVYFTTGDDTSLDVGESEDYSIDCETSGKTIVDFAPTYGYYIDGGAVRVRGSIPTGHDVRFKIIAAPGTAYETVFCENVTIDDRDIANSHRLWEEKSPAKDVAYYSTATSTIRLEVAHDAADEIDIEYYLHIYPY